MIQTYGNCSCFHEARSLCRRFFHETKINNKNGGKNGGRQSSLFFGGVENSALNSDDGRREENTGAYLSPDAHQTMLIKLFIIHLTT